MLTYDIRFNYVAIDALFVR